jgi:hypothetical protein
MRNIISYAALLLSALSVAQPVLAFELVGGQVSVPGSSAALLKNAVTVPTLPMVQKTSPDFCWDFKRPLYRGDVGADVRALHTVLEKEGFEIKADFNTYTKETEDAVKLFQAKYAADILVSANVFAPTGSVGLATRTKLNALYGCSAKKTSLSASVSQAVAVVTPKVPLVNPEDLLTISADASLDVELDPMSQEDQVGVWGEFNAGPGNANRNPIDFAWKVKLKLSSPKTISSITLIHNAPGDVWSTSKAPVGGKLPYPLGVVHDGERLNTYYDQSLGAYQSGTETFLLFGQRETEIFEGGKLIVTFTDGTSALATITTPRSKVLGATTVSAAATPSFTVVSPNGGEVWRIGTQRDVVWTSNVITATVPMRIILRGARSGKEFILEDGGATNSGRFAVKIPENVTPGQYYIEIQGVYGSQVFTDQSDRPLIVVSGNQNTAEENVTCRFDNSRSQQKCFTDDGQWGCSGTVSCVAPLIGISGTKTNWRGTCDGSAATVVDGKSEDIKFTCRSKEPYVKVLTPNGGETFAAGSSQKITWEIGNPDDLVGFYLVPIGVALTNTLAPIPDSRTFTWTVPKTVPSGKDYKVEARLYRLDDNKMPRFIASDQSDKPFEITGGAVESSLTLLSPNGGDGWMVGNSYTISFTGAPREAPVAVYLERYFPAGSAKQGVDASVFIGEAKAGQSTFTYTVPPEVATWPGTGTEYKIKICFDSCNTSDSSDSFFTLAGESGKAALKLSGILGDSQAASVLQSIWSILSGFKEALR